MRPTRGRAGAPVEFHDMEWLAAAKI